MIACVRPRLLVQRSYGLHMAAHSAAESIYMSHLVGQGRAAAMGVEWQACAAASERGERMTNGAVGHSDLGWLRAHGHWVAVGMSRRTVVADVADSDS